MQLAPNGYKAEMKHMLWFVEEELMQGLIPNR